MEISQDQNFPQFLINLPSKPANFNKNTLSTPISKVPFDFFLCKRMFFICKSALLQRLWENISEATGLCVGQQICITGTFPNWREDFSSLDL